MSREPATPSATFSRSIDLPSRAGAGAGAGAPARDGVAGCAKAALAPARPLVSVGARSPLPLSLVAGVVVAQLYLALKPEGPIMAGLGAGVKAMLGCWLVLTLAEVAGATLRGGAGGSEAVEALPLRTGAAPAVRWPVAWLPRLNALHITVGSAALIAAALQRAPGRLLVNLLGFGLVAVPLLWVVQRRAGPPVATRAALAFALFAFVPTHTDIRQAPASEQARLDSPFRWTVGWPDESWILRHEIQPDRLAMGPFEQPMFLTVVVVGDARGGGQVYATLNGQELGPLRRTEYGTLVVGVPADLLVTQSRLAFELRQSPRDPALRLVAQRWSGGATLGPAASSFYDTRRWWPGTFNDAAGRREPGVYLLELRDSP